MPNRQKNKRRRRRRQYRQYRHTRNFTGLSPLEAIPPSCAHAQQKFGRWTVRSIDQNRGARADFRITDHFGMYAIITQLSRERIILASLIEGTAIMRIDNFKNNPLARRAFTEDIQSLFEEFKKICPFKVELGRHCLMDRMERLLRRAGRHKGVVRGEIYSPLFWQLVYVFSGMRFCVRSGCKGTDGGFSKYGKNAGKDRKGKVGSCDGGLCAGCVLVDTYYCSQKCQKLDWNKGCHICT